MSDEVSEVTYDEEEKGNLPFLLFFQSKGGWPSFNLYATYAEVLSVVPLMRAVGLKPHVYRHVCLPEAMTPTQSPGVR